MARSRLALWPPLTLGISFGLAIAGVAVEPAHRADDDKRYVIPPGTGERALAGLSVSDVLPQVVTTRVGQPLVVINQDTMRHTFGPFVLEPGQSWSRAFASSGDYSLDCSIYPAAGFTIEVSRAEGALGVVERMRRGWIGLWILIVGAFAGGAGLAAMGFTRTSTLMSLAALLPASAAGLTLLGAVSLSRLAAWGPVLGSRSMLAWGAASLTALAASGWFIRAHRANAPTRVSILPAFGLALLAFTFALWPDLEMELAARSAFIVFGAALLLASLLVTPGRGRGPAVEEARSAGSLFGLRQWNADASGAGRLAVIGLVLFVTGLPQPQATPPVVGLLALPGLALGIGLLTWSVRRAAILGIDRAWFAGGAGMAVILLQTAVLWSAVLGHLDAVTLPAWGNPVPVDESSLRRGETLWAAECAACHTTHPAIESMSDTALLELITRGHETAPGLAYKIDVYGRGDIVNYLRAKDAGD